MRPQRRLEFHLNHLRGGSSHMRGKPVARSAYSALHGGVERVPMRDTPSALVTLSGALIGGCVLFMIVFGSGWLFPH